MYGTRFFPATTISILVQPEEFREVRIRNGDSSYTHTRYSNTCCLRGSRRMSRKASAQKSSEIDITEVYMLPLYQVISSSVSGSRRMASKKVTGFWHGIVQSDPFFVLRNVKPAAMLSLWLGTGRDCRPIPSTRRPRCSQIVIH